MRRIIVIAAIGLCCVAASAQVLVKGEVSISNQGKPVKDESGAVVWLTPVGRTITNPVPEKAFWLTQKNKQFEPHLLVVPVGSEVEFPNGDPFFHNVFSVHDGVRFDLGLYESGSSKEVRFSRPGVSYIFCNIHPEMSAVIIALTSPYYAITGQSGTYSISGVAPGDYDLHFWYERADGEQLKALTKRVSLTSSPASIGLTAISQTPSLAEHHKNKFGQDYEIDPGYKTP